MVDSVEIETVIRRAVEHYFGQVEEVWWTLSRLKPIDSSKIASTSYVEEVWWTLSRLKLVNPVSGCLAFLVEEVWWTLSRLKRSVQLCIKRGIYMVEEVWWTLSRLKHG